MLTADEQGELGIWKRSPHMLHWLQ